MPTTVPTTPPTGACSVDYVISNQWGSGFQANVTIRNNSGTAVQGWQIVWRFAGNEQFGSGWNANFSSSGQTVTASNVASHWNGTLAANGGTAAFGFQGTHNGNVVVPASFTLNGTVCGGGTPEPTVAPTAVPTNGPSPTPSNMPLPTNTPTPGPTPTSPPPGTHVDNPYVGAIQYVNPEWSAKAAAEPGGGAVADISTGVWLDRIAAIEGTASSQSNGPMGLRDHLDAALAQGGGQPIVAQFVIYNLPGRDCSALASNGELGPNELPRYKSEYIDPIAEIMSDPAYASVRIVAIIEIDSLPNLITNLSVPMCATVKANGAYVQGIQYALDKLHAIPNVYTYVDAGHHGWLGWDTNFGPTAALLAETAAGTIAGYDSVDGFITNTANYSALVEEHFSINGTVNGQMIRQSDWVDWNYYLDELSFAQAFRQELISRGFSSNLGMLIDTSRNGWGGSQRPTGPSSSTVLNTFVDESRIDRRIHAGNWCNQAGAGLGERPQANPEPGIDAYVWIKPPGESDGSSELIPNNDGKGFDRMCDPTYTGNERNGNSLTGALPNAPISGAWFSAQFQELLANAYPPLD
ncbi:MAG: glycoside hydrolase family 6 protein [Chloroflexota bacterium]